MLRVVLGVMLGWGLITASCGSDDGKNVARPGEGGEAGSPSGEAGSPSGEAGSPGTAGATPEGGVGGTSSGGAAESGAAGTAGPTGNAGASEGGAASNGGQPGAAGSDGEAGAGGAGGAFEPAYVSVCGADSHLTPAETCAPCAQPGAVKQLTCADLDEPAIIVNFQSLLVDLAVAEPLIEPFPVSIPITFEGPDSTQTYAVTFDLDQNRWRFELSDGSTLPGAIIVEPFTSGGACDNQYQLIEPIRFEKDQTYDYYELACGTL